MQVAFFALNGIACFSHLSAQSFNGQAPIGPALLLPNAPGRISTEPDPQAVQATGTASLSGTVEDLTGAVVPTARVSLIAQGGSIVRTITAGELGRFTFTDLPPATYRISATARGMGTYVSAEIHLPAGKQLELSQIALALGPTTADVEVVATPELIAQEQVHEQEKQRAFGIIPNFYSSYIWDAAPMTGKQKFSLAFHSILDPVTFAGSAVIAGIEYNRNIFPGYGDGFSGYAKRYGAAFADGADARLLGSAILPTILHQDPRYFYRGTGSTKSRFFYAISRSLITRGDSGHLQPNYSKVLGNFAAGGIAYSYHPATDRQPTLVLRNGLIGIGANAVDNILREFLLRRVTPGVPDYKSGKAAKEAASPGTPQ